MIVAVASDASVRSNFASDEKDGSLKVLSISNFKAKFEFRV